MAQHQYDVPRLAKRETDAKKKTLRSSVVLRGEASPRKLACQCATHRVQELRREYWQQVKDIDPENLVFLDETGVLLGLTTTHARSPRGRRVYDLKPYYRGARVTVLEQLASKRLWH